MDAAELQAENELVADLTRMAEAIHSAVGTGESRSVWQERREEIAALRQRIRTMRDRHLHEFGARPRR